MRTIKDFTDIKNNRSNNLAALKFIAAILVIFSHAYPILGLGADPLSRLCKGQMNLGALAITVFFFASGFYVAKSICTKGCRGFFKNRLIRIYPAFAFVVLITAFVAGPILSTLKAGEYFSSKETWSYLLYLFMIPVYKLPGVFEKNAIYTVNGSLWTLILEVILYVAIFIAVFAKLTERKKWVAINIFFFALMILIFGVKLPILHRFASYLRPAFLFLAGADFYMLRDRIVLDCGLAIIAFIVGVALTFVGFMSIAAILCLPYIFSVLIFSKRQLPKFFEKTGNYSYAMYLTAFPIQQTLAQLRPGMNAFVHSLLASAVAFAFSVIIFHVIEKPAGRLLG